MYVKADAVANSDRSEELRVTIDTAAFAKRIVKAPAPPNPRDVLTLFVLCCFGLVVGIVWLYIPFASKVVLLNMVVPQSVPFLHDLASKLMGNGTL